MAKTIINLTDTLATLVTKTNTISNAIGDLALLETSEDSDIVGSINSIVLDPIDSADVISLARTFAVSGDKGLIYNSGTGNFDIDSANVRGIFTGNKGLIYNSGTGNFDVDSVNLRGIISVTDVSGDGSLSYNASTGVLTYTGPSAAEVRAHISAGEGIDISSGEISGENASTSNKGIAKFAAADFSVSTGEVSLVDIVSSHFGSPVTLTIYDSAGSTLKTIRSPGS